MKRLSKSGSPDVLINRMINSGGMGNIYLAKTADFCVCVKRVRITEKSCFFLKLRKLSKSFQCMPTAKNEKSLSKRNEIENEIHLQRICEHPFVLKLYDEFWSSNFVYLVSELCAFSVDELCNRDVYPMIPIDVCYFLAVPILEAICYIHSLGVVHLDIKPENILVSHFGIPKLCDFGISVDSKSENLSDEQGTYGFIAPELYYLKTFDCKADMYSFGATLSGFTHQDHFNYRHAKLKEVFSLEFPKVFEEYGVQPDDILQGYYNIKFGHNESTKSYHEFIRLFIKYKSVDRLSAKEALQQNILLKYRVAWQEKNLKFQASMACLKEHADTQGLSIDPVNLLVRKCNHGLACLPVNCF